MLFCTTAAFTTAEDYPSGLSPDQIDTAHAHIVKVWGTEELALFAGPITARIRRVAAGLPRPHGRPTTPKTFFPHSARPFRPMSARSCRQCGTPTLVIHCRDFQWAPLEHGRYLAEHLPDARLLVVPGN